MKVLIIAYVWPEPNSSAAGLRSMGVIRGLLEGGHEVICASPSKESEHSRRLGEMGVATRSIGANDPAFDAFVRELAPDCVIFDRFVTEEQFGWRVEAHCPEALRVLDTQDLHFLRRAREAAFEAGASLADIFGNKVKVTGTDTALREIASIYRSDLTWVISDFERDLLVERFGVPHALCAVSRFFYGAPSAGPAFSSRLDFTMLGNFRHPPNADGLLWLKRDIWPAIRRLLPDSEVHVYGAYPPREVMALTDDSMGFHVMGPVKDQYAMLSNYRVNLAPLRFGAGIKGKISDGWFVGTPAVTTPVGSEGMTDGGGWGGAIGRSAEELARQAVELHSDERRWQQAHWAGHRILKNLFDAKTQTRAMLAALQEARADLENRRERNLVGAMLRHHLHKSTTYLSRWIELKAAKGLNSQPNKTL